MAERRMFAKTIIDSDAFIDMPLSTQALYFHLSMRADDEGFINSPKKIQRMVGATEDDLKLLIIKNFIIPFDSGVVVIKHWKIHNYIRKDRMVETVYQEEKKQLMEKENGAYTFLKYDLLKSEEQELEEETLRQKAYRESALPYSFDYKVRQAFVGEPCPICNCIMGYTNNLITPTIQHNVPISKGGKHELGNISVICRSCNSSIQDNETSELNNQKVVETWDKIQCQSDDGQMSAEDSIEENSIVKNSIDKIIKIYEEEIGFLTPFQLQVIENYLDDLSEEMILEAIKRASKQNKKSLSYIEGIMKNWIKSGYKTLADIKDDVKPKPSESNLEKAKQELGISSFDDLYDN